MLLTAKRASLQFEQKKSWELYSGSSGHWKGAKGFAADEPSERLVSLFEPFEILRRSNQERSRKEKENAGLGRDLEIWLPGMDSNHDSRLQRPLSYH